MRLPRVAVALLLGLTLLALAGCGAVAPESADIPAPAPSPAATSEATPTDLVTANRASDGTPSTDPPVRPVVEVTPEPTPEPTPVPTPAPTAAPREAAPRVVSAAAGSGVIVGGAGATYTRPTTASTVVRRLADYTQVKIVRSVVGQNWIVGTQDWDIAPQDWQNLWYELDDGSYIYSAFVYTPKGEYSPFTARQSRNRMVLVDISDQAAYAVVDGTAVYAMAVTTGKAGYETPIGEWRVISRVANERMTSQRAGIDDPAERYDVERVLFTQYFAEGGFALHLNYWRPYAAFGGYPTSHGCVGLLLHDAQYMWIFAEGGTPVVVRP